MMIQNFVLMCAVVLLSHATTVPPAAVSPRDMRPGVVRTLTIVGTVRGSDSRPLEGVQVMAGVGGTFNIAAATTTADGRYQLRMSSMANGTRLALRFARLGYNVAIDSVIVRGDSTVLDKTLSPATLTLNAIASNAVIGERQPVVRSSRPYTSAPIAAPSSVGKSVAAGSMARDERVRRNASPSHIVDASGTATGNAGWDREQYDRILDNPFLSVKNNALSTFSVDVDRASYGNVRRFLTSGQRPPADAVRIEELINYFPYRLNEPRGDAPVAITTEVSPAPWQPQHQLVRIALQARRIETAQLPASNLVFLIDVSGSMSSPDKLPLVKSSLRLLVEQLRPQDRVAMVVYAGAAGLVLPSTSGEDKSRIMEAIDRLESGGSTAGGAGIELAYRTARENFLRGGNNRVILATDGDFNIGASSDAAMERLIESKRAEGTYLTVLGYGRGNYQDAKMEKMAKVGNGNYAYVDDLAEARKVLVHEMGATLVTVANDVKLQIEFNPARVASYRLIGYEDRLLANEDFTDDTKDAGDMGAGHTVTALYELVPVGVRGTIPVRGVDSLRYTPTTPSRASRDQDELTRSFASADNRDELLYVKLRYKRPGESVSKLIAQAVHASARNVRASDDFRFASAVAEFGMLMRNSEYRGAASVANVIDRARGACGDDAGGYRQEFVRLAERWRDLGGDIAERRRERER